MGLEKYAHCGLITGGYWILSCPTRRLGCQLILPGTWGWASIKNSAGDLPDPPPRGPRPTATQAAGCPCLVPAYWEFSGPEADCPLGRPVRFVDPCPVFMYCQRTTLFSSISLSLPATSFLWPPMTGWCLGIAGRSSLSQLPQIRVQYVALGWKTAKVFAGGMWSHGWYWCGEGVAIVHLDNRSPGRTASAQG